MTHGTIGEMGYLDAVKHVNVAAPRGDVGGAIRAQITYAVDLFVSVWEYIDWERCGR